MPNQPNYSKLDLNNPNYKAALDKAYNSLAMQGDAYSIGQQLQQDFKLADEDVPWATGLFIDSKARELAISYLKQA